jgi:hypothetical protein
MNKLPTDEERHQFVDWMNQIRYLSPKDPGPFVIRRLTKVEYGNTLRDLFGVDSSVADELPDEVTLRELNYKGFPNEIKKCLKL